MRFCLIRIVKLLSRRPFLARKREAFFVESQEDMTFDGTTEKVRQLPEERLCCPHATAEPAAAT